MSENEFWLKLWLACIAGLVAIVVIISTYQYYDDHLVVQMVEHGADPLKTRCIMGNITTNMLPICTLIATH